MNMISNHHNYDFGYIALVDVKLNDLQKELRAKEYDLLLKSEFHISLINATRIAKLIDEENSEEVEAKIVEIFKQFIKNNPLTDYEITNEFRLVKRDSRVTLVVMVKVPGIEDFFKQLEEVFGKELPVQPTHITLYTSPADKNIGILSQKELEEDSEVVEVPISL